MISNCGMWFYPNLVESVVFCEDRFSGQIPGFYSNSTSNKNSSGRTLHFSVPPQVRIPLGQVIFGFAANFLGSGLLDFM
jgi:hypothetical protein